jgi:hypothetical protein
MATKRKPTTPTSLPSAALQHGMNAYGARYLRKGFAETPELDLAFALGYGGSLMAPATLFEDGDPGALATIREPIVLAYRNACALDVKRLVRVAHEVGLTGDGCPVFERVVCRVVDGRPAGEVRLPNGVGARAHLKNDVVPRVVRGRGALRDVEVTPSSAAGGHVARLVAQKRRILHGSRLVSTGGPPASAM